MNYNELSKVVHQNAREKGFWKEPKSDEHCLALVITEVAEAIEADRKGKRAFVEAFKLRQEEIVNHDHLDQIECFVCDFAELIKDTVEDEFADIVIRLLDLAGARGFEIDIDSFDEEETRLVCEILKERSFTESAYAFIGGLTVRDFPLSDRLNCAINGIVLWSKMIGVNLEFHIEQKMKYNSMREVMHGKKY